MQRSKLTDKYVRRRQRQNVTMGGQPATPLEAVRAEVLVVEVLGHFLEVLHVGSVKVTTSEYSSADIFFCRRHVLAKTCLATGVSSAHFHKLAL